MSTTTRSFGRPISAIRVGRAPHPRAADRHDRHRRLHRDAADRPGADRQRADRLRPVHALGRRHGPLCRASRRQLASISSCPAPRMSAVLAGRSPDRARVRPASRPTARISAPSASNEPGITLGCSIWAPDGKRLAAEGWNDQDANVSGIFLRNASDGAGDQAAHDARRGLERHRGRLVAGRPPDRVSSTRRSIGDRDPVAGRRRRRFEAPGHRRSRQLVAAWSPDGQWLVRPGRRSELNETRSSSSDRTGRSGIRSRHRSRRRTWPSRSSRRMARAWCSRWQLRARPMRISTR